MRAIVVEHPGGPDVLQMGEAPDPVPGPGELLARVHATALNRLDLLQREGRYPLPPGAPDTLGVEMAGEVTGWGDGVTGFSRGDRVCALLLGGGYAEQVAVPAAMAIPIPATLSYEEAAAIPEVLGIEHPDERLLRDGAMPPDERPEVVEMPCDGLLAGCDERLEP